MGGFQVVSAIIYYTLVDMSSVVVVVDQGKGHIMFLCLCVLIGFLHYFLMSLGIFQGHLSCPRKENQV